MFSKSKKLTANALIVASMVFAPSYQSMAAPGTLPDAPLFLSTIVEPNIFFTLDDSGSMDWGPMVKDGTDNFAASGGLPIVDGYQRAYYTPTFTNLYSSRRMLPPANINDIIWDRMWVFRTHQGNGTYYNPAVKYVPWSGTDAAGNPLYQDANPQAALEHPDFPGGEKIDLTVRHSYSEFINSSLTLSTTNMWIPTYYRWADDCGGTTNGVIENCDTHTRVEIAAGTDEMQNFANWFQYYRSRMNAAKSIMGNLVNNTDAARMGYRFFDSGFFDVDTMSDPANKRTLLRQMYSKVTPIAGTPARRELQDTGQYFEDKVNGPIFGVTDGGECQQNFNILMSDGFWNGANPSPSVGNADFDGSGVADNGFDGNVTESVDNGNYADAFSNTLADVAMHFYENDLRDDLGDKVPTIADVDEANHQHLVTYSVAFGLTGSLDPATDNPLDEGFTWPQPVADTDTTVDDMWHAAYNGRGKFLSAQNPAELQASMEAAITDIAQRTGTAAAVAINSAQLSLESVIYLAQFNSNRWQGNLLALPIIDTSTGELATTPKWDASALLTARDVSINPRTIITYDNTPTSNDGVPFQWLDISSDMTADLNTNALGGTDTLGEARLNYLRGDRSNESSGLFRPRLSMLGDIVNSGPVFVGEPDLAWPDFAPFPQDAAAYSKFKTGPAKTRKKMVYVGANDGMLHAFDDDSGEEVFAYVPGMLSSSNIGDGLHYLTEPNYLHKFYVDQTPTLSDVFIGDGAAAAKWRTVLVGAMRGGARGLYALDVTDPATFSEANADDMVLWEFTNADDPDLGYTYSRPFIAYANNNTWVAIFGNGYNPDTSLTGVTGEASLYIVNIEAGTDGNWKATDYKKISTGVGTVADPNGLATPALADVDGNGTVDRVYAGDLKGNMWAFDLEGTNSTSWNVAYTAGSTPSPLFVTQNNRPITSKPVLAKHPSQPDSSSPSNAPNIMVYFGTGQYLVDADKTTSTVESFYGVWDKGDSNLVFTDLIEQFFETGFTDSGGNSAKVLSRNAVDYSLDHGWHFKLEETGERSVTSPIARADTVFFNSFVPVNDPCSVGGFGFRFAVDMTTGGSSLEPVFNSDDSVNTNVIDENDTVSDGTRTSTVAATRQEGFLPEPVFIEDLAFTAKEATKVKGLKDIPTGRFSWQELIQ